MSDSELISVIMPAYNAEKHLAQAIESVLKQSYPEFELLIINDGSRDGTEEIIQSYDDPRIRYFKQENQGVSAARNMGLANMKGAYFCFLDADDVMPCKSLESRLEIFKANSEIVYVDGKIIYFDKELKKKIKEWLPDYQGNPLKDLLYLTGKSFFGNTWMIKRSVGMVYQFNKDLSHGEDLLFYLEQAEKGGLYSFTLEPVLYYRTGHVSAMNDIDGLKQSYHQIFNEINRMDDIPLKWKKAYLKKAKSIVWKSYLGNSEPLKAIKSLFDDWGNN